MSKEIKGFARKSKDFQQNQRILKEIKDSQKKKTTDFQRIQRISKEVKGFPRESKDFQNNQIISKEIKIFPRK